MYFDWQRYNTPYRAGGLADQPYALMHRMRVAHNVYEAMRAYRTSKDWGALQANEPWTWSVVETVILMRQEEANGRY